MEPLDNDNLENLEIIVRDKSAAPVPTRDNYQDWISDRRAASASKIYDALEKATLLSLKPKKNKETDEDEPPPQKALEFAAEILGLRSPDGSVSINQTFNSNSGNTTISNGASIESIIRAMDRRDSGSADKRPEAVEAEFEEVKDESKKQDI